MISANGDISYVVGRLIPDTVLVVKKQPQLQGGLSAAQAEQVDKLQKRDQEVRSHESAHVQASQGTAIAKADLTYQIGPDKKAYATDGEVKVQVKADINNKEEALAAADTLRKAAQAPIDSSAVDAQAAIFASEIENKALAADKIEGNEAIVNEDFETNIESIFSDTVDALA